MTDRQALRATIDKAKRFNYQKVVMRITLAEELLNELDMLSKSEWKLAGELTAAQMDEGGLKEKLATVEKRNAELTEFVQHVNKCLRKNGEYAPLSHELIQTVLGIRADGKGGAQ